MSKSKLLRKVLSVSLCAATLGSASVLTGTTALIGTAAGTVTVSAATTETPADSFQYETNSTGEITITKFIGKETDVVIPSSIEGKKVTAIGIMAFASCGDLESVIIPDSVTSIDMDAFYKCTALKSVKVSNGVTDLNDGVFSSCYVLTNVTLPKNLKTIGKNAFHSCIALSSLTLPASVVTIGESAFNSCIGLTAINIPNGVTTIGKMAFNNCTALASVSISKSVTTIERAAFANCPDLTAINVSADNPVFSSVNGILFNKNRSTLITYPNGKSGSYTIPGTVKKIDHLAFAENKKLTSVTIPDSVTYIGELAFFNCQALTGLNIPDSVETIDIGAFCQCSKLETIRLSQTIGSIRTALFSECSSLTKITIPESVTSIDDYAFSESGLTEITIPNSVTYLGRDAFASCDKLKTAIVPPEVAMEENPFSSCISLTIYSQKGSETEQFAKKYQINFEMAELVNQSTLSTDTVILGESVTVNCQVNGGARPCTYAVYYRKAGMTKWTLVQNYSEKSHVTITPKTAVNYEVRVVAKDAANTVARKDMKLTVQKPLTNTSVLGAETIRLGEKVKVRCFAEGGAGNYQFAVYYKKATSQKWTKLRGYSSQNIVMLQPAAAAVYDVMVYCKDASGKIVNKTLQLTVQAPLKNNSRLSTERITLGEKVKVRCLAEGGAGEYQYAVYYKKSTSTNWTKLRDYASGNLVIMTPKAASVYDIRVDAKDADNTVTSKTLTLTVTK